MPNFRLQRGWQVAVGHVLDEVVHVPLEVRLCLVLVGHAIICYDRHIICYNRQYIIYNRLSNIKMQTWLDTRLVMLAITQAANRYPT